MAKVKPFHSKLLSTQVYHDESRCTEGNNIEKGNRVGGTGGLRKCSRCREISDEDQGDLFAADRAGDQISR
jgi:hypothetical protein